MMLSDEKLFLEKLNPEIPELFEVQSLYREMGKCFDAMAPWQVYILSSYFDFERHYGRHADKVRKLYNGMIPCNLYQYFKKRDK